MQVLMSGRDPEHFWIATPVLTSYWLPPWQSVHSLVEQFMQSLL